MLKNVMFATLICISSFTAVAEESPVPRSSSTAKVSQVDAQPSYLPNLAPAENQSGLTESQAYKLLYEAEKSSNAKIIEIMQWSIGILN